MPRPLHRTALIATAMLLFPLAGCMQKQFATRGISSPYPSESSVLIAVAPARNESGASFLNTAPFTVKLAEHVQGIEGLGVVPLPRVARVMSGLELRAITSPESARSVARAAGADAILVSTITSWNPYDPPKIGVSAALYTVTENAFSEAPSSFDPRLMGAAWSDRELTYRTSGGPSAGMAELFDARDVPLRRTIEAWAVAKDTDETAMGWSRYVKSIDAFATFVSHRVIASLLEQEHTRIAEHQNRQAQQQQRGRAISSEPVGTEIHQSLTGN